MKQTIKTLLLGLVIGSAFVAMPLVASSDIASAQVSDGLDMTKTTETGTRTVDNLIENVINILLWAIGIIAVIMIIIGGIRYATSNGDSNQVSAAKNTIMYSVVGLVIAIFAYAIVKFVIDKI